jgi:hemerythrin-like domain-containing protein
MGFERESPLPREAETPSTERAFHTFHGEFAVISEGNLAFMLQPRGTKPTDITGYIAEFRAYHSKLSRMCERLEGLADSLPDNVGNQECLLLARSIYSEVKRSHEFEENALFPEARACDPDNLTLASTLERLRYEHWEDESFAEELTEALTSFVTEPHKRNPEKLAYMLRGFFEGMRRHIAFEREHLIPLLLNLSAEKP